ncbi:MAG: hypothetical protein M1827_005652 [Pycnora praestabilis]|nr:MAG: hypothetical protein M1827_005652 [Pycnora praestabilis]
MCASTSASGAAPKSIQNMFFQPQQCKTPKKPPCIYFDHTTSPVHNPHYRSTSNAYLLEPQAPLGVIDWQEQHDAIAFRNWYLNEPHDNALHPFAPIDYEPSSLDHTTAHDGDDTIFDDLLPYSPDPATDSVPAGSKTKSSPKNISIEPGSSSVSRSRVEKRKANTLAARRYRQNRLDKVAELESALKATQLERAALQVQVAKLQGENLVLKDLVRGPTEGEKG